MSKIALHDTEEQLAALLFPAKPALDPQLDEERQLLYRRLVRNSLSGAITRAIPIARKLLGEEATQALLARYLEEQPVEARFIRDVPSAFAAWASTQTDLAHPALGELLHWECLELDVTEAPDPPREAFPGTPDDDATIVTHPSARLAAYRHPVHRLTRESTAWPEADDEPALLLAFRTREALDWVRLAPVTAKVLMHTAEGGSIGAALKAIAEAHDDVVDARFVRARLVDLERRGALLGFPRAQ